jgi:energy-converting hydrogenase Eha subunit E
MQKQFSRKGAKPLRKSTSELKFVSVNLIFLSLDVTAAIAKWLALSAFAALRESILSRIEANFRPFVLS